MTVEHIELTQAYEATPGALADVAAEAIRALNHATFPGAERLVYPSEAYTVIGSLQRVVGMLPQALEQLWTWLEQELAAGRVIADYGRYDGRTEDAVTSARAQLALAVAYLANVHVALGEAHIATAGLSVPETAPAAAE